VFWDRFMDLLKRRGKVVQKALILFKARAD
jgi:hypothetical protein